MNPAWSPDGQTLAFQRTEFAPLDEDRPSPTTLYTIPVEGGKPTRVARISDEPLALYQGIRWLPDGEAIAVVHRARRSTDPRNGLWVVDVADGSTRPIVPTVEPTGDMQLLAVAGEGRALIWYPNVLPYDPKAPPRFALVDLDRGGAEPIAATLDLGDARPEFPAFSPDGAAIVYTVSTHDRLIARDLATGEERDLLADLPAAERPGAVGFRLDWAANGLIYVSTSPFGGTLLRLDAA